MDHELKQRLIGAVVVTALAAIFIPMLFDDPVDNSGQQVSELAIPKAPDNQVSLAEKKLPDDFGRALTAPDPNAPSETDNTVSAEGADAAAKPQPPAADTPVDEELVATEADSEDAAPTKHTKNKPAEDSLDTGEVLDVDKTDVIEPAPVKQAVEKTKQDTQSVSKAKKKPKQPEADTDTQKTTVHPETDTTDGDTGKTKAAAKKSGLSRWTIQAGSFSKKENALAQLEKLKKEGFPVTLQSKGDIYRLKIGPELDKQRAVDMKKKLEKLNVQSLMIAE